MSVHLLPAEAEQGDGEGGRGDGRPDHVASRRPVAFTIANDHPTMTQAIDRGVPVTEVKKKCPLVKDLDAMDRGVAAALGLER